VIKEFQGNLFKRDWRREGHHLADRIFGSITGKKSIFKSKVIFVSDATSKGRGKKRVTRKEIYVVDFDGANRKRITHHGGIVISPAISPKGDKLVYSLIKKGKGAKRIELYLLDLVTKKRTILSRRKGLNSGGTFLPSGDEILLTLSNLGNAEIYAMNLASKNIRRVTQHYASDVDPSVNGDGSMMTFLSSRSGKAHIYTLDPRGKEKSVKRISFVGMFNATPRFSPDGKEIVFSSWLDNRFDLFKINPDGTGLARLTKDFGSNESPSFSNDGEFIVFSSQRVISKYRAVQNIYMMDREGQILGAVVKDFGNCLSPRWTENFIGF
jgi:TolB protein